jgi:hypothetical protein
MAFRFTPLVSAVLFFLSLSAVAADVAVSAPVPGPPPAPTAPVLGPEIAAGSVLGGTQYQTNLRVSPLNAQQMALTGKAGVDEMTTFILTTRDGGMTWKANTIGSSGDPDAVYDLSGNLHVMFIDKAGGTIGHRRSTDAGLTWSATQHPGMNVDHPYITVDRSQRSFRGSLYIAGRNWSGGGLTLAYSRDGGTTWKTTSFQSHSGVDKGLLFGPTVLRDGTVLIPANAPYVAHRDGDYRQETVVFRSTNGGISFTKVTLLPLFVPTRFGPGWSPGVSNLSSGLVNGKERVYLCFGQLRLRPTPTALMLVTSDDGGLTWSAPAAVAPSLPVGWGAGACSVMVNKDGVVGVQYFSSKDPQFDLFFVYSKDGGKNFSSPVRISSATSRLPSRGGPRYLGQDQIYADVAPDGSFRLVWTDARDGAANYTVYTRSITVR